MLYRILPILLLSFLLLAIGGEREGMGILLKENYILGNKKSAIEEKGITYEKHFLLKVNESPNFLINPYIKIKNSKATIKSFITCDCLPQCADIEREAITKPENTIYNKHSLSPNIPALNTGFEQKKLRFLRTENSLHMQEEVERISIFVIGGRAIEENILFIA